MKNTRLLGSLVHADYMAKLIQEIARIMCNEEYKFS